MAVKSDTFGIKIPHGVAFSYSHGRDTPKSPSRGLFSSPNAAFNNFLMSFMAPIWELPITGVSWPCWIGTIAQNKPQRCVLNIFGFPSAVFCPFPSGSMALICSCTGSADTSNLTKESLVKPLLNCLLSCELPSERIRGMGSSEHNKVFL